MVDEPKTSGAGIAGVRQRVEAVRDRSQRTLLWQVWDRMLEIEFVDRSVALAGKAFVSFFPLVIVVASFMPKTSTLNLHDPDAPLGVEGTALVTAKQAFASTDDIRRATGILGLVLTHLLRELVHDRAPAGVPAGLAPARRAAKAGEYLRGPAWFLVAVASMAVLGGLRGLLGNGPCSWLFVVASLAVTRRCGGSPPGSCCWARCVAGAHPLGRRSPRVAMAGTPSPRRSGCRRSSAEPNPVRLLRVRLALVTWFSGAAICIIVGACAGAVFAQDPGRIGTLHPRCGASLLVPRAEPSFAAPAQPSSLRDAFRPTEDDPAAVRH